VPPTRRGGAATANWTASAVAKTITLTGPLAGDKLGLWIVMEDGGRTISAGPTTTAGSTSAWTQRKNLGTNNVSTRVYFYEADVTADGTVTVSFTPTASALFGGYLFAYANATLGDLASKDPTATGGSSVAMDLSATANYTLDGLTTGVGNAAVEFIVGDWTASATSPIATERIETDAGTMTYIAHFPGNGTNYGVHGGYYPDAGAAGAKNVGFTTLRKPTIVAVEVRSTVASFDDAKGGLVPAGMFDSDLNSQAWF
jgi:hypothetical protein